MCFPIICSGLVIGYALSYFKSFTIPGQRVLYLEDLYVRQTHRNNRVGVRLLETVELFARESGCFRLELQVLRWNPATSLYKRSGALNLTESDGWHQYRITGDALATLAKWTIEINERKFLLHKESFVLSVWFESKWLRMELIQKFVSLIIHPFDRTI